MVPALPSRLLLILSSYLLNYTYYWLSLFLHNFNYWFCLVFFILDYKFQFIIWRKEAFLEGTVWGGASIFNRKVRNIYLLWIPTSSSSYNKYSDSISDVWLPTAFNPHHTSFPFAPCLGRVIRKPRFFLLWHQHEVQTMEVLVSWQEHSHHPIASPQTQAIPFFSAVIS